MIGFFIERAIELFLARRGRGAEAVIHAIIAYSAVLVFVTGLVLNVTGQTWLSGFFIGASDTLFAIEMANDLRLLRARQAAKTARAIPPRPDGPEAV